MDARRLVSMSAVTAVVTAASLSAGCRATTRAERDARAYMSEVISRSIDFDPTPLSDGERHELWSTNPIICALAVESVNSDAGRLFLVTIDNRQRRLEVHYSLGGFVCPRRCALLIGGLTAAEPSYTPVVSLLEVSRGQTHQDADDVEAGSLFSSKLAAECEALRLRIAWLELPTGYAIARLPWLR